MHYFSHNIEQFWPKKTVNAEKFDVFPSFNQKRNNLAILETIKCIFWIGIKFSTVMHMDFDKQRFTVESKIILGLSNQFLNVGQK